MPRRRQTSPMADIYLAAKLQGFAMQINTEKLQQYLDTNPSDFSYKSDLQTTINYAKAVQQKVNSNANLN